MRGVEDGEVHAEQARATDKHFREVGGLREIKAGQIEGFYHCKVLEHAGTVGNTIFVCACALEGE